MKKMNDLKLEQTHGGDWWGFAYCVAGCLAECWYYECTNPAEDCSVGCLYVTV